MWWMCRTIWDYNNIFKDMPIEEQNNVMARYDYYDEQRVKKLVLKKKGD